MKVILILALALSALGMGQARADEAGGKKPRLLLASWYGAAHHGRRTASGERFDRRALTAAHRTLPFGTLLRLSNPENGRQVTVRINDRGPFRRGRSLDLAEAAASRLGMRDHGTMWLRAETITAYHPAERGHLPTSAADAAPAGSQPWNPPSLTAPARAHIEMLAD
jgi:rare lipoprotein A